MTPLRRGVATAADDTSAVVGIGCGDLGFLSQHVSTNQAYVEGATQRILGPGTGNVNTFPGVHTTVQASINDVTRLTLPE